VGGTKIAGGLVDLNNGAVLARRVIPTAAARGGGAVLADAVALAADLADAATAQGRAVAGVGLGICELVDPAGQITSAHAIDWRDLPVAERFAQIAPAVVESDVRTAALAEARFGAGQPHDPFAYITVGTGISSCLVQNGVPYAGARGNALVLATGALTTTCPACRTTFHPVLEEFASGPALVARYNRETGASMDRGEAVMDAVAAGDAVAVEVVESAGAALGVSVGWLVNVLDPAAIVVGGGLGLAGGRYWERFVASTRAHIWAENSRSLPILPAALGADAGIIGAAAMVQQQNRRQGVSQKGMQQSTHV
jgi:glucokinase